MSYVADHRPMLAFSGLSNQNFPGATYGMHPDWNGADPQLIAQKLLAMFPGGSAGVAPDLDRVLLWQIAGNNKKSGFLTFASWHVLSEAQRGALAIAFRAWKSIRPHRKICLYMGWTTDPFTRDVFGYGSGEDRWWHQQIGPLVDIGLDEVALDGASDPQFSGVDHVTDLLRHHYGLRTLVEAIPLVGNQPDLKRIALNPAVSWWQTIAPYPWKSWPAFPPSVEVHIFGAPDAEQKALSDRGMICGPMA